MRVDYLEQLLGESVGNHANHKASMEKRLELIEKQLGDNAKMLGEHADNHSSHKTTGEKQHVELRSEFSKDLQAAKKILTDLEDFLADVEVTVNSCAKAESLTAGLKRVDYLEQLLGESKGNHANYKASMENRLELIEKQLGDNVKMLAEHADNHSSHKTTVEKQHVELG